MENFARDFASCAVYLPRFQFISLLSMQKVALLGATGLVGSQILKELLESESIESVRALVRDPSKVNSSFSSNKKLELITGDASNIENVKQCLTGCTLLISSLSGAPEVQRTLFQGVSAQAKELDIKRFILISGILFFAHIFKFLLLRSSSLHLNLKTDYFILFLF